MESVYDVLPAPSTPCVLGIQAWALCSRVANLEHVFFHLVRYLLPMEDTPGAMTWLRPDVVKWSQNKRQVLVLELTVPWEEHIEEANQIPGACRGLSTASLEDMVPIKRSWLQGLRRTFTLESHESSGG